MTKEQKFLLLVVLIIAGASVAYYYTQSGTKVTAPVTSTQTPTTTAGNPTPVPIPSHSFSTDITYVTPEEGSETIHVTMSLSGDTINDISFTYDTPTKRQTKEYTASFERALTAMSLKGTKLSALSLSRTGGASLTTGAFMEAVAKIRTQATNG
jgi:uncharacterized protein (UPF0333 family)